MDDELRELRELVVQLKADNERLRQEQVPVAQPGSSSAPIPAAVDPPPTGPGATERFFFFVPRDRKCPKCNGRSGIFIDECVEEAQACMRLRHLSNTDQAFFLVDHLEGEAREEICYRSRDEREDPKKIIQALCDLYGCTKSYVALQESFFSRRQQDGESLLEFSLALMNLLEKVKCQSPYGMPNAETLLRDQFVEYVSDGALRRELKQLVRRQPTRCWMFAVKLFAGNGRECLGEHAVEASPFLLLMVFSMGYRDISTQGVTPFQRRLNWANYEKCWKSNSNNWINWRPNFKIPNCVCDHPGLIRLFVEGVNYLVI